MNKVTQEEVFQLRAASSPEMVRLIAQCISHISDTILITEALPLAEPGPRIVFVNEAFERQTGYLSEEVLGRSPRFLQGPRTDRDVLDTLVAALDQWKTVRVELVNYRKDGTEFDVEMDIVPISVDGINFTHWVSVQRNVTERNRAAAMERALEAQRVEAMETLTAGLAHDFNNIVAAILGHANLARQATFARSPVDQRLVDIQRAGVRARHLVEQILTFGIRRGDSLLPLELNSMVTEATEMLRSTLPANVSLEVTVPKTICHVLADAGQLIRVLMNLGTNAWHAMEGRPGHIRIEVMAPTPSCDVNTPVFAMLTCEDDGRGMDAETQARAFDPYFTTKPIGQGTGLGLSVVAGIVAAHGGTVSIASRPGFGTKFEVKLPAVASPTAPVEPVARPALHLPDGEGRHVLLVDDDEVVRTMLEGILLFEGFQVTSTASPAAALEAFAASGGQAGAFSAVVSDYNMPELSGIELAEGIARMRPGAAVVVGSGHIDDKLLAAAATGTIAALFRKECAVEELGLVLRRVLAEPRARSPGDDDPA